jgi:hypothetical protein
MKKLLTLLLAFTLLALISNAQASPKQGMKFRGSGGWSADSQYGKMFDPKTVETLTGEIVKIEKISPVKGMSTGLHVMLKTDKETISVHLGPEWYFENQDVNLSINDKVEIKGSRITFQGNPAIIAAELKKGEEVLKIRDENGYPAWSGWRKWSQK